MLSPVRRLPIVPTVQRAIETHNILSFGREFRSGRRLSLLSHDGPAMTPIAQKEPSIQMPGLVGFRKSLIRPVRTGVVCAKQIAVDYYPTAAAWGEQCI